MGRGAAEAVNNAAKLLAARGELTRAETILRAGQTRFFDNAKIAGNLAEIVRRHPQRQAEAQELYRSVIKRFPEEDKYQQRYRRYFPAEN